MAAKAIALNRAERSPLYRARRRKYVSLAFSPDGQILADTVTCSADRNVRLWNLDLDDLLASGCDWLRDYLQNNPNVSDRDKQLCDGIRNIS